MFLMKSAMRRQWWPHVWGLLLVALVPVMCFAAEKRTVRIGHFPNLTHAQALYSRATRYTERLLGYPIQWTSFNAGPSAIEAIFTDAVDMTFVGPNPAINGYVRSKGRKFVVIAGAAGGGGGLVVRGDSGIGSEKDFNGKTIATPQLGNTQDVAARQWFAEKGYRLTEKGGRLALVPLANPDQLTMFRKKQIDGLQRIDLLRSCNKRLCNFAKL